MTYRLSADYCVDRHKTAHLSRLKRGGAQFLAAHLVACCWWWWLRTSTICLGASPLVHAHPSPRTALVSLLCPTEVEHFGCCFTNLWSPQSGAVILDLRVHIHTSVACELVLLGAYGASAFVRCAGCGSGGLVLLLTPLHWTACSARVYFTRIAQ